MNWSLVGPHLSTLSLSTLLIQMLSPPACKQVNLAVDTRTDRRAIPFSQITIILGVSKGPIVQHYQRRPTEKEFVKRPRAIDELVKRESFRDDQSHTDSIIVGCGTETNL
jgi:hypothetical protein